MSELEQTIEELEAEMVDMKKEFDVKKRQRSTTKEALAFAKFLKRL